MKLVSKSLSKRLQKLFPNIVSSSQNAFVKGSNIGDYVRLIDEIFHFTNKFEIPAILLAIDFEKAFDSIDPIFLMACMEKMGFGPNFLAWVSILLKKNESCVSNGGHTTRYFQLKRGARQGDPIAAYFFIIVLEIFFIMIKSNNNIKKVKVLDFEYLYTYCICR